MLLGSRWKFWLIGGLFWFDFGREVLVVFDWLDGGLVRIWILMRYWADSGMGILQSVC